jgi:LysM repeat protein
MGEYNFSLILTNNYPYFDMVFRETVRRDMMSYKILALNLSAAFCLSACATHQENPNYQYSSKYEGPEASTQLVTNTSQSQTQTVVYSDAIPAQSDVITASTSIEASPYEEEITVINAAAIAPSPTDQAYVGQEVVGTPGYGLYVPEDTQSAEAASTGAQAIDYDYSENFVSTGADVDVTNETIRVPSAQSIAAPLVGANYVVREGDTVYSMARRLCVGLNEIAGPNNLDQSFGINIGQALILPESRC